MVLYLRLPRSRALKRWRWNSRLEPNLATSPEKTTVPNLKKSTDYLGTQPLPTLEELKIRLTVDIEHFGPPLPERVAIAWRGYFSALLEWSLLSVQDHDKLWDMLPEIENDPVKDIMLGRDEEPTD